MTTADEHDPSFVSGDAFRAALVPTRDAIRALCVAIKEIIDHRSLPAADSKAMAEIAAEPSWARRSEWENPISDTHTLGAMILLACTDCARAFAQAIDADEASLYGHLVLTRSVLETGVVAAWLNAPRASVEERVRRGVCEQLYSAMEVQRLKIKPDARTRVQEWKTTIEALGFTVATPRGKPVISGSTARPGVAAGIDELVLGEGTWSLGRIQWSLLSAVSHGTWYGLTQAFQLIGDSDQGGMTTVAYGASAQSINTHAACVLGALASAADCRFTLMGWGDPGWEAAKRAAVQAQVGLLQIRKPAGP